MYARIYIELTPGCQRPRIEGEIPDGYTLQPAPEDAPAGATHELHQSGYNTYYSPGYTLGNWSKIAAALMELHASPDVLNVWYQHDDAGGAEPFSPGMVLEYCRYFMANGQRPSRGDWNAFTSEQAREAIPLHQDAAAPAP